MLKVINGCVRQKKGSKYSACIDLSASEDVVIGAGETKIVGLGVYIDEDYLNFIARNSGSNMGDKELQKVAFLNSHYLQLEPRSSLRAKGIQAGTGIIDLDYVGLEIKIILHNPYYNSNNALNGCDYVVKKGDKIAQIMLCEHKTYLMGVDSEDERVGGFGSSGN